MPSPSTIRPTDDAARRLARSLLSKARHAALAVTLPEGAPYVSRIALGLDPKGRPTSLISSLAPHTGALEADPACALLLGEAGAKGDPLTHPRLTLMARARIIARDDPCHASLAAHYLQTHPKSKLYAGFTDFRYVLFDVEKAHLNGGFGRAFHLTAEDLTG